MNISASPFTDSFLKRTLDVFLSSVLLTSLFPAMLLITIWVILEKEGPPIFSQKRTGKNNTSFIIYKFRTMVKNAEQLKKGLQKSNEADGPVFKIKNDPRYTEFGKILARSGLDELPQLINVLKGEMSLVGPRPLPVTEAIKISKKYQVRHLIKPGITSSWIIEGAHKLKFNQWMELDKKYLQTATLQEDLKIIFLTSRIILRIPFSSLKRLLQFKSPLYVR